MASEFFGSRSKTISSDSTFAKCSRDSTRKSVINSGSSASEYSSSATATGIAAAATSTSGSTGLAFLDGARFAIDSAQWTARANLPFAGRQDLVAIQKNSYSGSDFRDPQDMRPILPVAEIRRIVDILRFDVHHLANFVDNNARQNRSGLILNLNNHGA